MFCLITGNIVIINIVTLRLEKKGRKGKERKWEREKANGNREEGGGGRGEGQCGEEEERELSKNLEVDFGTPS